jgi:hypothetical protein
MTDSIEEAFDFANDKLFQQAAMISIMVQNFVFYLPIPHTVETGYLLLRKQK